MLVVVVVVVVHLSYASPLILRMLLKMYRHASRPNVAFTSPSCSTQSLKCNDQPAKCPVHERSIMIAQCLSNPCTLHSPSLLQLTIHFPNHLGTTNKRPLYWHLLICVADWNSIFDAVKESNNSRKNHHPHIPAVSFISIFPHSIKYWVSVQLPCIQTSSFGTKHKSYVPEHCTEYPYHVSNIKLWRRFMSFQLTGISSFAINSDIQAT